MDDKVDPKGTEQRGGRNITVTEDDNDGDERRDEMNGNDWKNRIAVWVMAWVCLTLGLALCVQNITNSKEAALSKKTGYDEGWKRAVLECKRGNILRGPLILSGGVISNVTFHIVHIMDEPMLAIADNSNSFKAEVVEVYNDNGGAMWIGKVERPTTTE